jgi:Icc-related predicted phosphoesterase
MRQMLGAIAARGHTYAVRSFALHISALFSPIRLWWLLHLVCCVFLGCSEYTVAPPFSGEVRDTGRPRRIVVYGDTQSRHPLEFWQRDTSRARRHVAYRIAQIRPDAVINAGDLVDRGGSAGAWKVFDEENAWLRRMGVPYYPVLGNHEFMGGSTEEALDNYFSRFPYLRRRRWYRLPVGAMAFLMLDSNFDEMTADELRSQLTWIQNNLAECERDPNVRMAVIVIHHPPFTHSTSEPPNVKVTHLILPLIGGNAKCKLFFSGHIHSYERFRVGGVNYIVSGGGGGPLDHIGEGIFPEDLYKGGPVRGFHYCLMTLYRKQCTVEMFELQPDLSWVVRDSLEIKY